MRTKKFRVSHIQRSLLEQMKQRGVHGIPVADRMKIACRALVRHGLASVKAGYEATYRITPAGRAWLAAN